MVMNELESFSIALTDDSYGCGYCYGYGNGDGDGYGCGCGDGW